MRKRQNFPNSREVDRISNLPDCLLHEILSFLNTKYVVQTSVLSKRWRYIWKSIPNLNFDFDSFPFQEHSDSDIYKDKGKSFKKFIRRVLSRRHGENIRKFEYFYDEDDEDYKFVKKLIHYAVCHNVQQLCIDVYYVDCLALPDCFATCKSLNAISITCGNLCGWRPLHLLALKSMYLESCVDYPDAYGEEIISGCPNLESLVLFNYPFQHLSITAPKLSHLEIYCGSYRLMRDSKIVISAPRLTSVEFEGLVPLIESVENLSCLDKVSISAIHPMHYGSTYYSDGKKRKIAANLIPMLYVLRSAKSLTLSMTTMEILSMAPHLLEGQPSLFCNLRHLKLKAERKHTVISMPVNVRTHLLKNSPCVETMVVEHPEDLMNSI